MWIAAGDASSAAGFGGRPSMGLEGSGSPVRRRRTSAAAPGLRASLPLKITSSILSPRRLLALCSPSTHVMASATLLLPQPLGPTMAVTPWSKASSDRSEKDLNPDISRRSRRIFWYVRGETVVQLGGTADSLARPSHCGKVKLPPQYFGPGPHFGDPCRGPTTDYLAARRLCAWRPDSRSCWASGKSPSANCSWGSRLARF